MSRSKTCCEPCSGVPCLIMSNPADSWCCFDSWLVGLSYLMVALMGMRLLDFVGTPRRVSLRLITSYQRNSSAGEHRCRRGEGQSCSQLGHRYIERYGAFQGWLLACWVMVTCSVAATGETCPCNPCSAANETAKQGLGCW